MYDYKNIRYVLAATRIIPNTLEFSSCLHVSLLMFFRLLSVRYPLSFKILSKKLRHTSIITIWATTICGQAIPLFILPLTESKRVYSYVRLVLLNISGTIPVITMVIMNILFAYTVKKRKACIPSTASEAPARLAEAPPEIVSNKPNNFNEKIANKTNSLVQIDVVFLLICYTPYLIFSYYYYIEIFPRHDVKLTPIEVN